MRLIVVTPPLPIISVPEVQQRGIGVDQSGDVIEALIDAACAQIEPPLGWPGRAFGRQTLEVRYDELDWRFGTYGVNLAGPVVAISSFKYLDSVGTEQTLDPSGYSLAGDRAILTADASELVTYTSNEPIRVRYTAGYELDDRKLAPAKQAVALMVKDMLSSGVEDVFLRSETVEGIGSQSRSVSDGALAVLTKAAERLLQPYRIYQV